MTHIALEYPGCKPVKYQSHLGAARHLVENHLVTLDAPGIVAKNAEGQFEVWTDIVWENELLPIIENKRLTARRKIERLAKKLQTIVP